MGLTYVVPDIHGRHDLLAPALERIGPDGKIVFLGDYIDRGPDSAGVISAVMRRGNAVALMGNHEQMAVSNDALWLKNGGDKTLASFGGRIPADVLNWMAGLPLVHEDRYRVYVHAGVDESCDLCATPHRTALWHRYSDDDSGGYRGKHVVHGHTPTGEVDRYEGRTNLDAGAYMTGRLCVGVFDDDTPGGPVDIIEARI